MKEELLTEVRSSTNFFLINLVSILRVYCLKMSHDIEGNFGIKTRIVGEYKAKWKTTDHIIIDDIRPTTISLSPRTRVLKIGFLSQHDRKTV